jgi:thioredoxin-related protein
MNRSLVVFLIVLSLVCGAAFCFAQPKLPTKAAKPASKVQWHTDLRAAHKVAVSKDQPILVVVGGPNCGYCTKLEKETLADAAVSETICKKFVAVHLDFERDQKICEALAIDSLPTVLVLSHEADVLGEQIGFCKKDKFQKLLQESLDAQAESRVAKK